MEEEKEKEIKKPVNGKFAVASTCMHSLLFLSDLYASEGICRYSILSCPF